MESEKFKMESKKCKLSVIMWNGTILISIIFWEVKETLSRVSTKYTIN